jgi:GLPGLI family protein
MRKIFLAAIALASMASVQAQQKEGKVIYQRVAQMQIQVAGNAGANDMIAQNLPKSRTDKFELSFGGNKSILKHMDEEMDNNEINGNGMQIRMMAPGQDDIVYHNFDAGTRVDQREMFDKKFIVNDSVRKLSWKLGEDTKTILGHECRKATAQRTGKRMQMTMDNGKMERKEIDDTSNIVAWFTTDIPVSAGPDVQGQLPGLILALDLNDGRMVYQAIELSPKVDLSSIKEPTKGKKVTPDEFTAERNKMMDEMQRNNQGNGARTFRVQN